MDLSQLSIGERVGRGGMGTVHRAVWKSPTGGVPVAVKFLAGSGKLDAGALFLREARAAARLSHPNVVTLLDAGRVDDPNNTSGPGIPYIVMEWVGGGTLAETPPTSWAATVPLLRQLLDALAHAHGWGVLHRDLKPANVMYSSDGVARLVDFGIGRVLDDPLGDGARSRRIIGTPKYMAPEQVLAEWRDEGPWTDVYGLATLTWELVTGATPFAGEPAEVLVAQARQRPPSLNARFDVPYGLRNWLFTALEKRPRDRFQSAAEALSALEDLDDGARTSRYPVVTPGKAAANVATRLVVPQRHAVDDRPVSSELRAAGAGLFGMRESPLVGRETQKEQIWNAFRRVSRLERAEVAFIRGERGTGKTALARWLARRAIEGGYSAVLRSTHDEDVAGEGALLGAVTRWFRLDGLDAAGALDRAAHGLGSMGFDEPRDLALDLVARCFPGTSERRGLKSSDDWHRFLLEFARLAGGQTPTVWIVDDVHLSEASRSFLRVAAEAEFGLLVIATTRDEEPHDLRRAFAVDLGPLGDAAMRELVHAMLPLEPKLTDTIVSRAQGSPMFATQLIGDWVSRDVLQPGPLGYRASDEAVASLPDGIHAVWRARTKTVVTALGDDALDALRLVAVMGEEVALNEWRHGCALLELPGPDGLLEALAPFGLVRVERQHLRVAHALLRESILRDGGDLSRYHLAAADAVAAHGNTPTALERSARHLWAAGKGETAVERLQKAVLLYDEAGDPDAVILLVPVLKEWAAGIGASNTLLVAEALLSLGAEVRFRGGEAGNAAMEEAAQIVFAGHDLESILSGGDRLRSRLACRVLINRGAAKLASSPSRAMTEFRDGYRLASHFGLVADAILCATYESDCLRELGRIDDAYDVLDAAMSNLGKGPMTPRVALTANERIADMCELRGDFDGALEAMDRAYAGAEAIGDHNGRAFAMSRRADFLSYAGRLGEAREWAKRAAELYGERGSWAQHVLRASVLMFDTLAGNAAENRVAALHTLKMFEDEPFRRFIGPAAMMAAACEAADGNLERAAALFAQAQEEARNRLFREIVMLAVAVAEHADGQLLTDVTAFARAHAAQLPPIYSARLDACAPS